jgi:hypothetical protein
VIRDGRLSYQSREFSNALTELTTPPETWEIFLLINGWRINATQQQIYRFLMQLFFDSGRFELAELDKWFRPRIVKDVD